MGFALGVHTRCLHYTLLILDPDIYGGVHYAANLVLRAVDVLAH